MGDRQISAGNERHAFDFSGGDAAHVEEHVVAGSFLESACGNEQVIPEDFMSGCRARGGEGRQQVLTVSLVLCVSCRVLGQGDELVKERLGGDAEGIEVLGQLGHVTVVDHVASHEPGHHC